MGKFHGTSRILRAPNVGIFRRQHADFGNWQGCRSNPDALPFFELHDGYVLQRGLPQLLLALHK